MNYIYKYFKNRNPIKKIPADNKVNPMSYFK